MKPLIALTTTATKRYLRNKTALIFSLFIPLALIMVFGAFTNQTATKLDVGIIDKAQNQQSQVFISTIKQFNFNVIAGNEDEQRASLDKGKRDFVVVINENFGQSGSSVTLLENQGKIQQAEIGKQIISQVLDTQYNYKDIPRTINLNVEQVNSKNLTTIDFLVPGLIAQSLMQLGLFSVAFAFVTQKATGILKRVLATPVRPSDIIISESFARIIVSLLQVGILVAFSILVYKLNFVGNIGLFFIVALLTTIIFLSMGFAIAGWAKDENQVPAVANVISLPMILLSGVFFSRDIFPMWLKTITDFFPLTYAADAMREIMNNGGGLEVIGKDIIGLAVWAVISFAIAYKLFKWE